METGIPWSAGSRRVIPIIRLPPVGLPHTKVGGAPGAGDSFRAEDFASWKLANGINDDTEDRDGDGLGNLLEYAPGSDPSLASPSARPVAGVIRIGSENFPRFPSPEAKAPGMSGWRLSNRRT